MKKYLKLFLLPLFVGVVALSTVSLTSCGEKEIVSVEVNEATVPAEIIQGTLDSELAKIKLVATLEDGSTVSIDVTKDMISASDLEKLADIGTHRITIVYEGHEIQVKLTIVEDEEVVQLTDITLSLENANVEVAYGAAHTALTGVKAVGNDGVSYASQLTYTITNAAGETVNSVNTYVENEVYTVVISINYLGISKSVTKVVTVGAKPDTSGNLIPSGEFTMTDGAYDGWDVYSDQSSVVYESEVIGDTTFAKVVETSVAGFAYSPRLHNKSGNYFTLYAGTAYKVSFDAKALATKTIQCQVGQLVGGAPYFYDFGGDQYKFSIGTQMANYSFVFVASNLAGGETNCSSVTFELGTVTGDDTATTVWLGNVVVEEYSGTIEDTKAPVITANNKTIFIGSCETVDVLSLISVNDAVDGEITPEIVIKDAEGNTVESISGAVAGVYTVSIHAVDAAGNEAEAEMTITVKEKPGTTKVDFASEDGSFAFGAEAELAQDTLAYWNDQNWVSSNVTVNSATVASNVITIDYSSVGACSFGLQLFYKNSALEANVKYVLTAVVNTQNAIKAGINGKTFDLVAGSNEIVVVYVEGEISSIDIQFGIVSDVASNVITLSNVAWDLAPEEEESQEPVEVCQGETFALEDAPITFAGEGDMSKGDINYWNDQNWVSSNVTVTSAQVTNKTIVGSYSSTGACDFGLQLFYKSATLTAGQTYTLSLTINVENAVSVKVNDVVKELVAGSNEIVVDYVEGDISSIDIQFVISEACPANTVTLSNISWVLKTE